MDGGGGEGLQRQILVHLCLISSRKGEKSKKVAGNKKGQRGKKEVVNGANATDRTRNEKRTLTGSEKDSSNL